MSNLGNPRDPLGEPEVMDAADYRFAVRSHRWRVVFAAAVAVAAGFGSSHPAIGFGPVPCGLIGLAFAYGIGGKFFPDSDRYFWHSARNYRRVKHGKTPLGADQSARLNYRDDYGRG